MGETKGCSPGGAPWGREIREAFPRKRKHPTEMNKGRERVVRQLL